MKRKPLSVRSSVTMNAVIQIRGIQTQTVAASLIEALFKYKKEVQAVLLVFFTTFFGVFLAFETVFGARWAPLAMLLVSMAVYSYRKQHCGSTKSKKIKKV